jgi:uncharacterized protein YjbK
MNTNLEIEYKTLLTEEQFNHISLDFIEVPAIKQINFYYQYTDVNKPIAARIRQINQTFELTFKIKQTKGRLEVNFEVYGNDSNVFDREDIRSFLIENDYTQAFISLGELTSYRRLIKEDHGDLCIDENHYLGKIDYELEYEVTHDEKLAYARYLELVEKYHLSNEKAKTKYHRFLLCLNHLDVGEK